MFIKSLKKAFLVSILIVTIIVLSVASAVHAIGLIGSITAVGSPSSIAYDSGRSELFVVDSNSHNIIDVISDSSNSLVASIPVDGPTAIAYDSGKGEVSWLTHLSEVLPLFQSYQQQQYSSPHYSYWRQPRRPHSRNDL